MKRSVSPKSLISYQVVIDHKKTFLNNPFTENLFFISWFHEYFEVQTEDRSPGYGAHINI